MDLLNPSVLIMLAFVGLGILSRNLAVTYAMLFLLAVRITPPLNQWFPWIEKYGLTVGIVILTIGVMSPMASGKITAQQMLASFLGWKSLLAIGVGVLVSWLGGRGVVLMGAHPQLVAGLLVGTVLGVALFKGVPVGPLIAAGILSLMVGRP